MIGWRRPLGAKEFGIRFRHGFFFIVIILLFLSPLFFLLRDGVGGATDLPIETLIEAWRNTFILALGTCFLCLVFGFLPAWGLHIYPLWGARWLEKAFYLPLALPAYVLAFVGLGAFEGSSYSPQGQLSGLILVLAFSLYPYVFIFSRAALLTLSLSEWEAHQSLGGSRISYFYKLVFRKAAPFVASALVLVGLETMADFGAASIINVPVVTTLIYKVWFGFFSFSGALTLAAHYLLVIAILLVLEALLKKRIRGTQSQRSFRQKSSSTGSIFFSLFCWLLLLLTVGFPVGQIVAWFFEGVRQWDWQLSGWALLRSLLLAGGSGFLIVICALGMSYFLFVEKLKTRLWEPLLTIGYSIPGTVLAVAMVSLSTDLLPGATFLTSLGFLVYGLFYKFYPIAFRPLNSVVQTIPPCLGEYSQTTPRSPWYLARKGHWPFLRLISFSSLALVAIEVLKEMPMTLMLAPSSFETLSIQIFNFTSEGEWEKAAVPSLFLLFAGLISTLLIYRRAERTTDGNH